MAVRIRPTEAIHFAALAALALLAFLVRGRLADPSGILLRYAALAAGLLIITLVLQRGEALPAPLAFVGDFYPAALLPIVFNTLEPLIEAVRGGARDELLIAADRALFGVDVTVWLERFVRPHWNNLFFLFYATYYFFALTLGVILWFRDRATARRFVFTLMVSYYFSYAGYFTIPALGPRFAQASEYTVSIVDTPFARTISDTINRLEKTKCDVFPSGHTMIAVAALLVAWRRARDVFWYLLPVATGLIVSTVYCRYHYVVDLVVGAALAFVSVPVGDALYERLVARRRAPLDRRATAS